MYACSLAIQALGISTAISSLHGVCGQPMGGRGDVSYQYTAISSLDEECCWSIRDVKDQWEVVNGAEVHCIS